MKRKHNHSILALTVLAVLSGCASQDATQNETVPSKVNGTMNQPKVEKLVRVDDNTSPVTKDTAIVSQQKQEAVQLYQEKVAADKTESLVSISSNIKDDSNTTTPFILTNWDSQGKEKVVRAFTLKKGDTISETLANWLSMEGYKDVTTNLSKIDGVTFNVDIEKDDVYYTTLTEALSRLSNLIQFELKNQKVSEPRKYKVYILMNKKEQSAMIRSVTSSFDIQMMGTLNADQNIPESYTIYRGEEYLSALERWTYDAGYQKFGKLLDKEEQLVLKLKAPKTITFNDSFDVAATKLMYGLSQLALEDERTDRDGFISEDAKADVELHLSLNNLKREAIITSTNVPVTMFNVVPGSLRDNFLRLAPAYNWKASQENYMAPDYWVTFGYPIVSESSNFRGALDRLIKGYPKLRGKIVPSIRQAYVTAEE